MTGPGNWLLSRRLRDAAAAVEAAKDEAAAEAAWAAADQALAEAGAEEEEDVALPILVRSLPDVQTLVRGWDEDPLTLPQWDKAVLKRAFKAYRKRLKLFRLDDEASDSRNPLSSGRASSITGVRPPEQYDREIWDILIAQGKLRDGGDGLLELATV